ncbi:putative choline kinase 1 [Morella rubra]|uniref:Putative choline kinase 1 n=1 Tax=Morella rubra TaxID=262757 RepID=A0A6A1W6F0_9ROSI|nr:putative choline kinase 1 [Morella rubra]KAB1220864.1 putative choline kinase 1 [Morella rubra]
MAIKTKGFVKGCLPEELKRVLRSVAADWGDAMDDMEALQVIQLSGAMTNEVYQVNWPTRNGEVVRKVLVRVYGEGVQLFFNRDEEIRTFECISENGQGPRLLGQFSDGRVEEFIHARTLSAPDLRDPVISALIAPKMREFHNLDVPGPKNVVIWDRMRNWLCEAKLLCSHADTKEFCLDTLGGEISTLERELSEASQEVGFCHNDLQYGNIMIDEETNLITIIDYEYASYNPVAYDLANHFCEMAANYHTDTPHVLDYSKYPGPEERQRFVRIYLSSMGNLPSDAQVEQLVHDVEKYTLANHLFWGLWGIISAYVNKIDFDYIEYARQRFHQYWLRKPALLGSSGRFR